MIPRRVSRWLGSRPGPIGACASAYREWRWGDPHVRLLRYLCDRGRASIDVGAHAGSYTWFLRRYSGHCIAFEPNPRLVDVLRRRFPTGVDIRNMAVSDQAGHAVLRIPIRAAGLDPGRATIEANNALDDATTGHEEVAVETTTLDMAVQQPVGFIRIDVEGHELNVLRGAERILRQHRPNLILELDNRFNPGIIDATFAHLAERSYHGWFMQAGRILPIGAFQPERDQLTNDPTMYVWNFVFSTDP